MNDPDMKSMEIQVHGKVQGVGFRYYTCEKAQSLDLKGYVENRDDGTVVINVEGYEGNVMAFLKWCHQGPTSAHVTRLDYKEIVFSGYGNFEIKR